MELLSYQTIFSSLFNTSCLRDIFTFYTHFKAVVVRCFFIINEQSKRAQKTNKFVDDIVGVFNSYDKLNRNISFVMRAQAVNLIIFNWLKYGFRLTLTKFSVISIINLRTLPWHLILLIAARNGRTI
jgi:hypothetical protein